MAAKRAVLQPGSKTPRLLFLALQSALLVAAWTFLNRPGPGLFRLALVYVLAMWIVAGAIKLWISLAFSMAPFLDLLVACLRGSATSMWLVPGALLLASRSQLAVVAGLAAVVNSTRLLTSNRVPKEQTIRLRRAPTGNWNCCFSTIFRSSGCTGHGRRA